MPDIELTGLTPDTINDIELKLPKEFGEYLIRDPSMLFYSNTKPDFRSYFKGLYFQMNPSSEPLLVSLSIAPPSIMGNFYNSVVLYMHDGAGTAEAIFLYPGCNKQKCRIQQGRRMITRTATQGNKMIHINTTYRDTLSYLQGLNGVYTKISIARTCRFKK